ncbi:MAG: CxxC-x17-CxxC domain-containing protein [Nitrosopumilus sp.]
MELYKSKYFDRKKSGRNSDRNEKPFRSFRNSRDDRGSRYSRDDRGSRYSRDDRKVEYSTVTCADCGTECQVPFVPRTDKPVYCSDCFRQNKPQDSGNDRYSRDDRGSRYSRDDRGSRYSRDDRGSRYSRDNSRPRKSKSDKFLKKQESFFSDGSEKFYASLKEKLFEILGGKVCSSCGFKDEKALGFSHKFDDQTFDNIRRGGTVSSWGKYISEPELAREELDVLCLNCNEIRQPMSKPKESSSTNKPKKSRHFPR